MWIAGAAGLITTGSFIISPYKTATKALFTAASGILFLCLGAIIFHLQSEYVVSNHYERLGIKGQNKVLVLELETQLSSNTYNNRFYAEVRQVDDQPASGKVLVLLKQADSLDFNVGDRITVFDDINEASNARNRGDFDYKEYLKGIDVYGQVYVDEKGIIKIARGEANLPWYVELRNKILNDLKGSNLQTQPRAIIEALVLGQRQNIDPRISQNFRDAGVIHILALSGLHVGIILLILQFSSKWMLRIKNGIVYQTILIIILLWGFALLTGMSPSIMRAVTMFSFVAIGMSANKKRSVFHSLTISALVLLFIDSRSLFNVGFQLSYTAVLSIVTLQPIFASLLPRPKYWVPRNLWGICTVTLAAQIGVAPLSILYFHQFPLSFLLGNLLLLGLLPSILIASILFIVLLQTGISGNWLGSGLNYVFNAIIDLVAWISSFDVLVLKDLYLQPVEVVLLYLTILCLALFFRPQLLKSKRERLRILKPNNFLHFGMAAGILLLLSGLVESLATKDSFLVLHQSRGTAVVISNGVEAKLLTHIPGMKAYRREQSLNRLMNISPLVNQKITVDSLKSRLIYADHEIVIVDESGVYLDSKQSNPIILLSHSPKINLDQLITRLNPKLIISDGSNYRNMVNRWEKTCAARTIKFINTYEYGSVNVLEY